MLLDDISVEGVRCVSTTTTLDTLSTSYHLSVNVLLHPPSTECISLWRAFQAPPLGVPDSLDPGDSLEYG